MATYRFLTDRSYFMMHKLIVFYYCTYPSVHGGVWRAFGFGLYPGYGVFQDNGKIYEITLVEVIKCFI